jgi:hypothetical protein
VSGLIGGIERPLSGGRSGIADVDPWRTMVGRRMGAFAHSDLSSLSAFGRPGTGTPQPASHSSKLFRVDRFSQKNCNTHGKRRESDYNVQESVLLDGVCAYQEDDAGQDGQ